MSALLAVFRDNHNTQQCLVSMTESWKNILGKGGFVVVISMDPSKAFNMLNLDLFITKLGVYRPRKGPNYLCQRVRLSSDV